MRPKRSAGLPIDQFDVATPRREIGFIAGTIRDIGLPASGWAHRHTFYEIAYIVEGRGSHLIDFQTYPLKPATMYFLRPEQVHAWIYDSPIAGFLITFTDDFLLRNLSADWGSRDQRLLHALADTAEIRLKDADARGMVRLFKAIVEEDTFAQDGCVSVLQAYIHILLVKARRLCPINEERPLSRASVLARRFTDLVTERHPAQHTVRDCSETLGVTPGYLAETVKQVTGRTPGQIIRAGQVVEAERLLIHTEKTIAEIAYELGFRDAAYFGRFFKRERGVTPGDFRQGTYKSRRFDVAGATPG